MQQIYENEKKAIEQQPEKKSYIAPKLIKQGKVEEMTQFVPNPTPSQQTA